MKFGNKLKGFFELNLLVSAKIYSVSSCWWTKYFTWHKYCSYLFQEHSFVWSALSQSFHWYDCVLILI